MTEHPDLTKLAKPFPASMVQEKPGSFKAKYVAHARVVEKLLWVVGPYNYEITQLIKSPDGIVEGCIGQLTVEIDGRVSVISEVGDVEENASAKNNGARAKEAASDAFKRCAMRLGVGLDLWVNGTPVLHGALCSDELPDPVEEDSGDVA